MISVYLKPTNRCNILCDHCYVPDEFKVSDISLSDIVVNRLVDFVNRMNEDTIHIIWHGGEPLFYGVNLLRKYSKIIKEGIKSEVNFFIQTNLVLDLNELNLLLDYAKEYTNSNIGTSYDFYIRKYRGSHESFKEKWLKNVHFMVQNGIFVTVNITLTKLVNVELLFDFINEMLDIGVKGFHLERFTSSGRGKLFSSDLYLSNEDFFDLMIEILDRYIKELQSDKFFYLNPFDKMTKSYFFSRGGGCFSGDCMAKMITINPDGTVSNCPDLAFYDDYIFGNLLTDSFEQILYNEKRLKAIKEQEMFICLDCKFFSYCHGGCPHHFAGFDGRSCRKFFSVFTDKVDLLYSYLVQ